ncbi:MAG TPA: TlpA disulfide reductase family protein, partial [Candidatus Dormibacteraeota bacterium]|nr:TlpA disulfide reductase family protein [Candidatus Dormibacteraeota bacterium]
RYADAHPGVALVLVDPVDGAEAARGFVTALHVHAPVLLDDGGRVAAGYRLTGYPTTFFLRSDGTISSRYAGALSEDALNQHMSNLSGG